MKRGIKMTEKLNFFTLKCDKTEIISNIKVANAGGTPTDNYTILPLQSNTSNRLFKHGTEIDRDSMFKADSYEELLEKINIRLNKQYKPSKVKWVWQIQDAWKNSPIDIVNENVETNYRKLFNMLSTTIKGKSQGLETRYKGVRLSFHDFESELWDISFKAIEYYEQAGDIETEFTLLETLEMFWKTRINSFIKSKLYTKKHNQWYTAVEINELFPDYSLSPEQEYIRKETMLEIFNDSDLTEKERKLLGVISDYPNGSLREWGKELGINHPQTVKRLYESLHKKLQVYKY
jgi:hypothetical protein